MNLIIMQFSRCSVFLPFRSKYPIQLCSQKLSVCVPPLKRETKFRTHTAQPLNYSFLYTEQEKEIQIYSQVFSML
jgi:hypothetical protein